MLTCVMHRARPIPGGAEGLGPEVGGPAGRRTTAERGFALPGLAVGPGGKTVAAAGGDGTARGWDVGTVS